MADGIKIRELKLTNIIGTNDVFVIDKLSNITQENVTFQISFKDFKDNYIGDAAVDDPQENQILVYNGTQWVNRESSSIDADEIVLEGALLFPVSKEPLVFNVTVRDRTDANRFFEATTSDKAFYINNEEAPALVMGPGRPYRFDISHPSCSGFSLKFYTLPTNSGVFAPYTYNTTYVGEGGEEGAYAEVVFTQQYEEFFGTPSLTEESPRVLFYNCISSDGHDFMGNSMLNIGRIQDVEFSTGDDGGGIIGPFDLMDKVSTLETQVAELTAHVANLFTIE